jgi:hypothetical protein
MYIFTKIDQGKCFEFVVFMSWTKPLHNCWELLFFPSFVSTKSPSNYFWQDAIGLFFSFHHYPSYEVCGPIAFKDIVITIYIILLGF